jgi:ubiquinone/menaquinone biosynthesis C-methylase UbiE
MNVTDLSPVPPTHWQALASSYDSIFGHDPAMRSLYQAILTELERMGREPMSLLDLGTGTGVLLKLARTCYKQARLVGLDPAPAMLEKASIRMGEDHNTTFILGSAHQINASDNSFDAVVSNFALHHLTHEQKLECAYEVFRVLVPGGWFVFGDQHCRSMGEPNNPDWVEDIFTLLCSKAQHYLHTAGFDRMLLQVRLIPAFLQNDGEIMATVEAWLEWLDKAGFCPGNVVIVQPEFLYHRVIATQKPGTLL